MRKPLIAGNWKMNLLYSKVPHYMETLSVELKKANWSKQAVEVLLAAPFPFLGLSRELGEKLGFFVAAQNIHEKADGAYTGEVSIPMLKDLGIQWTLIGHSERRQYFNETDTQVASKSKFALQQGIRPIICIGETRAERESGKTNEVLENQLLPVLEAVQGFDDFVLAYEPVWAIGTGLTASDEQAQDAHAYIRALLAKSNKAWGEKVRILYGGSVKSTNIKGLMSQSDIDGALVGGASLDPLEFSRIVTYGSSH